jgi:hypothetical protein
VAGRREEKNEGGGFGDGADVGDADGGDVVDLAGFGGEVEFEPLATDEGVVGDQEDVEGLPAAGDFASVEEALEGGQLGGGGVVGIGGKGDGAKYRRGI